jgi:hypothetical protein
MKSSKLFLTMLFCGVCATSCNLQSAEHKKISDDQSSQKRISDKQNSHNLKKDSALRTYLSEKLAIKKFYDKFIFKEEPFDSISATPYCSKNLIQYLGELYHGEFDSDARGYAIWDFSVAWALDLPETDMKKPATITAIEDLGDHWYKISLNEHGYTGIIKIKVITVHNNSLLDDFEWIERRNH